MTPDELWNRILETMDTKKAVTVSVDNWPPIQVAQLKNKMRHKKYLHWKQDTLLEPYTLRTKEDKDAATVAWRLYPGKDKGGYRTVPLPNLNEVSPSD